VAAQQKVSIKAHGDCRSFGDNLKSSRAEVKRLEKQAAAVIYMCFLSSVTTMMVPLGAVE